MSDIQPLRLVPCFPASTFGDDVLALGGRCFSVRHAGAGVDGELLVAVPEVAGPQVLVPRGFGRPLLGRAVASGWEATGSGQVCSPRRWLAAGGVAARVRPLVLPAGPSVAAPALRMLAGARGPWLAVRLVSPRLEAAARVDGSLRRGPVAVVGARVVEVSPAAAAAGVVPGMSRRLALRRCPGLRMVAVAARDLWAEARALLEAEVGAVEVRRGALLVRAGDEGPAALLAWAEQLALRMWQTVGVRLRLAFSADAEVASSVARRLDADTVAWVPAAAGAAWRRRRAERRRHAWRGHLADVEGIIALARTVAARAEAAGRLVVHTADRRIELVCPAGGGGAAVESALRARAVQLGELVGLDWLPAGAPAARQLSLLGRAHGG